MLKRRKSFLIFIAFFTLVITALHLSFFRKASHSIVLEELYYIPLFLGAVIFGLKGGLLIYFCVSVLYIPYFFGEWSLTLLGLVDRLFHLLFTGLFTFFAALFVEREKRHRQQLEKEMYFAGIGQAAMTIAHDLKNPLIVILAFARRIKEGHTSIDSAIRPIIESAENMQKIVDGVMDFGRPLRLTLKKEDIRNVVRRALQSCQEKAREKEISFSVDVPPDPVYVEIDSLNLARALANLILNSIEASSKEQKIVISVAAKKNHIEATVKDFGSGMDKETLDNIFAPFYSKKESGTGLGMPIVKKIIDGHKGRILIASQPGLGTEVTITLPL